MRYTLVPLAALILKRGTALKKEFEQRPHGQAFADDSPLRMDFFCKRSPYDDWAYPKYPLLMDY